MVTRTVGTSVDWRTGNVFTLLNVFIKDYVEDLVCNIGVNKIR